MKIKILIVGITLVLATQVPCHARFIEGMVDFSPGTGKIGLRVGRDGTVLRVKPESPAEKSGIVPGDKVLSVDGKPNDFGGIHGTPNTHVILVIQRGDEQIVRSVERINEHLLIPYATEEVAETGNGN